MMTKEYMRRTTQRIEDALKNERPHDSFRVRYGLPDKPFIIKASEPMKQTTLDDFMDVGGEPKIRLPKRLYEFFITVHTMMLQEEVIEETIREMLRVLKQNYPDTSD